MNQGQGMFNRLGSSNTINWNFIEDIEYLSNDTILISFQSGRILEITDAKKVQAIKEIITIFPNIENDAERNEIIKKAKIQQMKPKSEIPLDKNIIQRNGQRIIKTDIQE